MRDPAGKRFLNLPNVLTLLRFALAPVFAWTVLRNRPCAALFIICLAGATDVLDGFTARALGLKTELGTLIDPLADKFLGATAFILLSIRGLGGANVIPLWLTAVVLGRDFLILAGGLIISLIRGRQKFTPTALGKISTVLQVLTVAWVVLANCVQSSAWRRPPALTAAASPQVLSWLYAAALAVTIASGLQYIVRGARLMFVGRR